MITEYLKRINEYCNQLSKAAVWQSSGEVIGNIKGAKPNYIYEFWCYLFIILDLKIYNDLQYCPGKNKWENRFPQSPSDATDKPKFIIITDEKDKYQICNGISIENRFGFTHAPDISVQNINDKRIPSYEDLVLFMDAKFTINKEKSLPIKEIYSFSDIVENFKSANNGQVKFGRLSKIVSPVLITNGVCKFSNLSYLKEKNIQILFNVESVSNYEII